MNHPNTLFEKTWKFITKILHFGDNRAESLSKLGMETIMGYKKVKLIKVSFPGGHHESMGDG